MPTMILFSILLVANWQIIVVGQERAVGADEARVLIAEPTFGARSAAIGLPTGAWSRDQWKNVLDGGALQSLPTCQLPLIPPIAGNSTSDFLLTWFPGGQISFPNDDLAAVELILPKVNGELTTLTLTQECLDYLVYQALTDLSAGNATLESIFERCPDINQLFDLLEERGVPIRKEIDRHRADIQALATESGKEAMERVTNSTSAAELEISAGSKYKFVRVKALTNEFIPPKPLLGALFSPNSDPVAFWAAAQNSALDPVWLDTWVTTWGGYTDAIGKPLVCVVIRHPSMSRVTLERIAVAQNKIIAEIGQGELDRRANAPPTLPP